MTSVSAGGTYPPACTVGTSVNNVTQVKKQKLTHALNVSGSSNAVVTCEIKSFQPSLTWKNFISAPRNLPEIISKLFQRLTAAHEYFPTCSMLLT